MQAIAISATLHKTLTDCSLYILPNETLNESDLDSLIRELPKPFILMGGRFKCPQCNMGSKQTKENQ